MQTEKGTSIVFFLRGNHQIVANHFLLISTLWQYEICYWALQQTERGTTSANESRFRSEGNYFYTIHLVSCETSS